MPLPPPDQEAPRGEGESLGDPSIADVELDANDPYVQSVVEWLNQPSQRAERAFLEAHAELLSAATDAVLRALIAQYTDDDDMVEDVLDHQALLDAIRRRMRLPNAIRHAYLNAFGGEVLDAPAWLEEAERQEALLEHEEQHQPSSEQAARGRVVVWRAALAHAEAEATLPDEARAYLLTRLWNALDDTAGLDKSLLQHEGIVCLVAALEIYDRERYPRQWATVHNNLGISYAALLDGDRQAHQEQALLHYMEALQVRTHDALPYEWAMIQNNLAVLHEQRISGDRRANQERAIRYYEAGLDVFTRERYPVRWATIQQNLGTLYLYRLEGNEGINIERAIASFEAALEVFTPRSSTVGRARARHSLGLAYLARVKGSRRENLRRAIASFEEALTARTRDRYPTLWANTQEHLGRAHRELDQAGGAGGMDAAMACYQAALEIYTRSAYPHDWARLQSGLGLAWMDRRTGDRAHNLAEAAQHFAAALPMRTLEADPIAHRRIALNLAEAEAARGQWEAAHRAYSLALEADRSLFATSIGVRGKDAALALDETREAATRDGYALARLGRYREAVAVLELGRARGLAEARVLAEADPERISDPVRRQRYRDARDVFRAAYGALQTAGGNEAGQEALARQQEAECIEQFRVAKVQFDGLIQEIREAEDPGDFLRDTIDNTFLLRAAVDSNEDRASVYLLATPWGGLALGIFPPRGATSQEPDVTTWDLPQLTSQFVEDLLEITPTDDPTEIAGGYTWAQEFNGFSLLADEQGEMTLEEAAARIQAKCRSTRHDSTLAQAAHDISGDTTLAPLVQRPFDALAEAEKRELRLALGDAFLRRELERCLPELERVVLGPLALWLSSRNIKHLVTVPCGALGVLPLAAMLQERQWKALSATSEASMYAVSVAPSIRTLSHDVPALTSRNGIYALGNPGTGLLGASLIWGDAEASIAGAEGHWATQDLARRAWLLTALATGRIVDVGSHGEYDYRDPLKSRLLLGRGETVTLADVLGGAVDLHGLRLLILSSCQSGIGDVRGARDEMRSVAVGMLQAGAQAVLAALWPVDDRATYLLITRFAQEWPPRADVETPTAALARAQRWLRDVTYDELMKWALETHQEAAWETQEDRESMRRTRITDVSGVRGQGVRLAPAEASRRIREYAEYRAGEGKGDGRPYAHPIYWAGFQVFGV